MGSLGIPDAALTHAQRVADAIAARIGDLGGRPIGIDAAEILTGRAALLGLPAPGRVSAGGASRLLASADGWWALTLSRPDDIDAVPALLELSEVGPDPWPALARASTAARGADLVARARLLGMPAALLGECAPGEPTVRPHTAPAGRPLPTLLVADLSSMWAGPLCGRLLAAAGATVVKVETPGRPDGTRAGHPGFYDWVNSEKLSYAVDLDAPELAELLAVADVVIEGSRPAGLARRGLGADQTPARPGRVWVRITGYGPAHPWVAFGDDAAAAGGLVTAGRDGPLFCGDAIADPLTGLQAAGAVLDSLARGGGEIVDVAMAAVAATYAALPSASGAAAPRLPTLPPRPARPLGADNAAVRRLVAERRLPC
ncbi:CoA transferase [Mycobacterium talmoniae]|uniref:CoA transferase n=1 Tax=Mycobacterium talmoniae TaxID=1858794 RepID=A0A1S1NP05_9MYCO|nr:MULTISPECIES: CoA transferase [Mycobacterium]OHV05948.1 CoA transferase [Mycobacterium talmoniae]TDH56786.1 CoA transferase [Mycobacterium eburneum]